jgi:hypothetical protein
MFWIIREISQTPGLGFSYGYEFACVPQSPTYIMFVIGNNVSVMVNDTVSSIQYTKVVESPPLMSNQLPWKRQEITNATKISIVLK